MDKEKKIKRILGGILVVIPIMGIIWSMINCPISQGCKPIIGWWIVAILSIMAGLIIIITDGRRTGKAN